MRKSWDTLPILICVVLGIVFLLVYHGPHQEVKIAVSVALFLSLFFWNGWRTALLRHRQRKEGLEGTARLLRTNRTGFRSGSDPELKLTLAVTGQSGETWEASVRQIVLQNELYAMAPGTTFDVLYDPRDKSKIVLNARSQAAGSQAAGSQAAGSQAAGSQAAGSQAAGSQAAGSQAAGSQAAGSQAATLSSDTAASVQAFQEMIARQDAVQKRLIPKGILAPAKVVTCAPLHATMNHRDPLVMLMLEVQPESDPVFMAQANVCLDVTRLDRFAPGCTVYVRYDPADTTQVALVGSEQPV